MQVSVGTCGKGRSEICSSTAGQTCAAFCKVLLPYFFHRVKVILSEALPSPNRARSYMDVLYLSRRAATIKDTAIIDARRCALTVIHFPEHSTMVPADNDLEHTPSLSSDAPACSTAAYDPAFLVPFCLQVSILPLPTDIDWQSFLL